MYLTSYDIVILRNTWPQKSAKTGKMKLNLGEVHLKCYGVTDTTELNMSWTQTLMF